MSLELPTSQFLQYINGRLVEGTGRRRQVLCPGDESLVAEWNAASKDQVVLALEAARDAFPAWSALPLEQRGAWMLRLREAIEQEADNILALLMAESGKLRAHASFETASLTNYLSFFLEQARCNQDAVLRDVTGGKGLYLAVREPVGVVAAALAWNFPMHNLATKLGPILASGCTAVIKPATRTPLSTLYFGEILHRIGFPKGVLNIVAGDAKELGAVFSSSPIPAMLTMIGSTEGGLQMIRDSATSVKRFSMELGGNAPVIVTEKADLMAAAAHVMGNKMRCAGQTCVAPQRAFVARAAYDAFVEHCVQQGKSAVCGCLDEDANTGPLISSDAEQRMQAIVNDAVSKGARVAWGGHRPEGRDRGHYYMPTVLTGTAPGMGVFDEEVFGPILGVMPYDSLEEAVAFANRTRYGLASYVWSTDLGEVNRIGRSLQFGIVNVNGPATGPSIPHGGYKDSGIGKDGSHYSLDEYYNIKGMRIALP